MKKLILIIVLLLSFTIQAQETNYVAFVSTKQCSVQKLEDTCEPTALGDVVITWDKHNSVVIINVNGYNKYYEITEKFKDGDTYAFKTRDMTNFLEKVNLIFDVPNNVIYVIAKEGILKSVVDLTKEF
jgi:type II secretory pathway component PulC